MVRTSNIFNTLVISFVSFPVSDWECYQEAPPLLLLKAEPSSIHSQTEYGNEITRNYQLPITNYQLPITYLMSTKVVEILSSEELRRTLTRISSQIIERTRDLSQLLLLGIHTRGVPLAYSLARQIEILEDVSVSVGSLDITFYRDDLDKIGLRTPEKTDIPFDLTGKTVVLVDDVIFKGRTIRAALNAVNEYGRPEVIRLAVLVDRGHRELPIHPDFVGKKLPTAKEEIVKVYLQDPDGRDAVELISN